jgi:hypothetical protein
VNFWFIKQLSSGKCVSDSCSSSYTEEGHGSFYKKRKREKVSDFLTVFLTNS